MARKIDVNRLLKSELGYELLIRGSPANNTVAVLRQNLRQLLRLEAEDPSFKRTPHNIPFVDDVREIEGSIEHLSSWLENSDSGKPIPVIETKFIHIIGRLQNSTPSDDNERKIRDDLLNDVNVSFAEYQYGLIQTTSNVTPSMANVVASVQSLSLSNSDVSSALSFSMSTLPTGTTCSVSAPHAPVISAVVPSAASALPFSSVLPSVPTEIRKSTPVVKWGISFTGDKCQSVNAFLEHVEELKCARNVSREQLFREAFDLFKDRALVWFRANRDSFNSWSDIESALREEYLPPDYDDVLIREIERRTQGSSESLGVYVAVMKNMFARLSEKLIEVKQIKIIRRNLTPFYQTHLGLVEIPSLKELIRLGKLIEQKKVAMENYVPPSRKKTDLEPDLAYLDVRVDVATVESKYVENTPSQIPRQAEGTSPNVCWNCGSREHYARNCARPKVRNYCYRCGKPNVTVYTCPRCSGNELRRQ